MATDDSLPTPLPARRRFQFSLRLLFLITALWAVILGWWSLKRDSYELAIAESYHVTYDAGTLHIVCHRCIVLSEKAIADSLATVNHLGPITGIAIDGSDEMSGEIPVALTSGAWNYIQKLNLKSFSITGLNDSDVSQLEKLSSLKELTLRTFITPTGAQRLQKALPNCRITVREPLN
jgi:hypothetical protein